MGLRPQTAAKLRLVFAVSFATAAMVGVVFFVPTLEFFAYDCLEGLHLPSGIIATIALWVDAALFVVCGIGLIVMRLRRQTTIALLLSVLLASAGLSACAQHVTENIQYTVGPEGAERGDLYQPTGPGPFPAIVFIHGGSWRSGSRHDFRRLATDLAGQGYAGFSIDYDLKSHSYPASLQEARDAVRFLRQHAVEYRIDPARIVVAGTSAGGEIAALVALTAHDDTAVSAAVILNGVFRLCTSVSVISRYLGGDYQTLGDTCKDASPQLQVHAGAPPFFVGHGTADTTVAYSEAELFVHTLQTSGVPAQLYTAEGGKHSYWAKKAFYAANLAAVETFLARVVPPAVSSPQR